MKRMVKKTIIWAAVAAVLVGAGYGLYLAKRPSELPQYRTEPIGKGDVTATVTATGTLSAVTTVQVGSQVSGIIAKLHADFNSRVSKGQLLAELDPTNFAAAVSQRKADLLQAEVQMRNNGVTYERQKRLLAAGLNAQADYDAAKAAYEASQAQVAQSKAALVQAQTNLEYTKIVSPVDGVVVDRQYDVGQTVAASFQAPTLFTIAQDLTQMQVQADVDQSDIGRVKMGQPAKFTVDAYPGRDFSGTIKEIRLNATVSQNVVTYPVILLVPNPEERLRPKMTADVTIEVAKVQDALRVPNAALRFRPQDAPEGSAAAKQAAASAPAPAAGGGQAGGRSEGQQARRRDGDGNGGGERRGEAAGGQRRKRAEQTVYVLGANGQLRPVSIHTGVTDGRYTVVVDGDLNEGDLVVTGLPTTRAGQEGRPMGMRF